jgi:hypothetical protein
VKTALLAAVLLLFALQIDAQTPAWLGAWRFEVTPSSPTPAPSPFVRATRRIEPSPRGIRLVEDLVRPRGGGQTLTIETTSENAQQGLRSTMVFQRQEYLALRRPGLLVICRCLEGLL